MNADDRRKPAESPQVNVERLTGEVGSEGGSPGDLEQAVGEIGTGSEAGEQWRPAVTDAEEVPRDRTGRRSP